LAPLEHWNHQPGPLDLQNSFLVAKLNKGIFINSFYGYNLAGTKLTSGSGSLTTGQGFHAYAKIKSTAAFSLSDQITIRVDYPLLRTWIDGAKTG